MNIPDAFRTDVKAGYSYAALERKHNVSPSTVWRWKKAVLQEGEQPVEPEKVYVPYPDFQIMPFKVGKPTRDEEDIVIVTTDQHAGRVTPTYNSQIYKERMDSLLDSAMDIINLHRPIRKAHVFDLGDGVQGENPYQGSKIGDVEMPALDQVFELAVPTLSGFLVSLAQGVEEVEYDGVPGNHGHYEKTAPDGSNWDVFKMRALQLALQNQGGIVVNPSDNWEQVVYIRGFGFMLFHGDMRGSNVNGLPLVGLRNRLSNHFIRHAERKTPIRYAYCGHWHTGGQAMIAEAGDVTLCPPLMTGDEWAQKQIGVSSRPIQLIFGVHPKYGRTWEYKIYTDKSFLPEPYVREEGDGH